MSYFFGTTGNGRTIKTLRKKHNRHRSSSNDREVESGHGTGLRHRKKHSISKKCILKPKSLLKESLGETLLEENISSKSKSKRCLHKEIARLVEENRLLAAKLNGTEIDLDSLSIVKKRDELLLKLKKKYQTLEKNYYELHNNHGKVSALLAQREGENRQLQVHHEQFVLTIKSYEIERNNFIAALQKLKNENLQNNEDISLLKNVVYRLNVEIERYQDKLHSVGQAAQSDTVISVADKSESDFENQSLSKSWGKVNFHALGPLLDAYQENINEKDELIKKYKKEFDDFSSKIKDIIVENEELHNELEKLKTKHDRYVTENNTIEKDAMVIKEQNDLLQKQISLQNQKMQEIHEVYKQKVESMSLDNNKLHKEYVSCKSELSNLKGKYEILNEGYEKLKSNSEKTMPISVHNSAIDECKRLFEELKQQYESEKKKLSGRLKYLEDAQTENEKQLALVTAERDQLKIQSKNFEKNLKRDNKKLDHLQSAVHSIQVSRDSFKHQLSKTTSYCEKLVKEQEMLRAEKNKLTQLLEEKEKENENIQYLKSNRALRVGAIKNQMKIVKEGAMEQLASLEKHIKNQELGKDQMKTEYQRELQRLKLLLQQKEEYIQNLQREKCAMQDKLELVWKAATTNEGKKVKDALKNANIYI